MALKCFLVNIESGLFWVHNMTTMSKQPMIIIILHHRLLFLNVKSIIHYFCHGLVDEVFREFFVQSGSVGTWRHIPGVTQNFFQFLLIIIQIKDLFRL